VTPPLVFKTSLDLLHHPFIPTVTVIYKNPFSSAPPTSVSCDVTAMSSDDSALLQRKEDKKYDYHNTGEESNR